MERTTVLKQRQFVWIFLFFQVFGLLMYLKSLNSPFLFDDIVWVKENPGIRDLNINDKVFSFNRPLVILAYKALYSVAGPSPSVFHLFSVCLHSANAFLVFLLAFKLLGLCFPRNGEGWERQPLFPLLAGTLFLLTPLHSMAVMLPAYLGDVLYAFFYLLGLILFLHQIERPSGHTWFWVVLAYTGGVLSKESVITFPAVCFLIHGLKCGFRGRTFLSQWKTYLFLLLVSGALLLHMRGFDYGQTVGAQAAGTISRETFLLTQVTIWVHYVVVFLLPLPRWLNADWDWPRVLSAMDAAFLASALTVLVVCGLLAWSWKRGHRLPLLALGMFFIGIMPFSSIVPVNDLIMEYRVYLPTAGLALGLSWLAVKAGSLPRIPLNARFILAAAIALGLATMNMVLLTNRLLVYKSSRSFWEDAARKSPGKDRVWMSLAYAYLEAGKCDEALRAARQAARLSPTYDAPWVLMGIIQQTNGNLTAALECHLTALRIRPSSDRAANHLAGILTDLGRPEEALALLGQFSQKAKDIEYYINVAKALARKGEFGPAAAIYRYILLEDNRNATVWLNLGNAMAAQGNGREAEVAYHSALEIEPGNYLAHFNLGNLYLGQKKIQPAEAAFKKALEGNPAFSPAHAALGALYGATKRYTEAELHLREYIEKKPDDARARLQYALIADELGQGDKARRASQPALLAVRWAVFPLTLRLGAPLLP